MLKLGLNLILSGGVFAALMTGPGSQAWGAEFTEQHKLAMGQGLYEQTGSNSCLYCHGIAGKDGKVAVAANLTTPKAWKTYKALGGDAAYGKDTAQFLARMKQATVALIKNGAVLHNSMFKEAWFDWSKTGGSFNAQMLGLGGAPSVAWVNKYKERGVTKDIAAEAVYLYLQNFDTQGTFKK